ncbi:MAG: 3-hydroxyacyl-CoA dehydrogenase family protein [Chthoniobacteraceae bacterium]
MNAPIRHVFVAGAGHMGSGIAQVAAAAGVEVTLYDVSVESVRVALEKMRWSLDKLHTKGLSPESADTVLARVKTAADLVSAADAGLVIEAVPERESLKRELFTRLDEICPPHVLFASNTSAIPITNLAAATQRAENFCGLHFFNPVPMLALVEVVRGSLTSDTTIERAMRFVRQIGKEPVLVRRDQAGFIVNRILGAAMGEAMRLVESGHADAADIDKAMRLGCAWKMGPLETADLAGLDVVLHMYEAMQRSEPNPVLAPPDSLRRLVAAGNLGRKSGRGFHDHTP